MLMTYLLSMSHHSHAPNSGGHVPVDMTPTAVCLCTRPPKKKTHQLISLMSCHPSSDALSGLKHLSLHNDRRMKKQEEVPVHFVGTEPVNHSPGISQDSGDGGCGGYGADMTITEVCLSIPLHACILIRVAEQLGV